MGFLKPKMPTPAPAPTPANPAITPTEVKLPEEELGPAVGSLISTSARGLKRRATTQRSSLIGGG
jgi:hypothetical protein